MSWRISEQINYRFSKWSEGFLVEANGKRQGLRQAASNFNGKGNPKIQGRVFEEAEAPQAAATQPQRVLGTLKSLKTKTSQDACTLQNSRGVLFLRSPIRRRQLRHRRTGLGGPEIVKNDKIHKMHVPKI